MRVCSEDGCPEMQAESRCAAHRRARERKRGSPTARGYGADHRQLRTDWLPLVRTGNVKCWRCGEYIPPGPFDLGHDDNNRGKHRGPEHVSCNRATAGRT